MKNSLRLLFFICCSALIFSSCQKEYSVENGITQISAGSLKDSTGNCLPDSVAGTFYDGVTPGGDTAYVEVQVNVAKTGSYTISTDLQNGFEFADSGFFTSAGINVIRLKPIGVPILPKSALFTVSYDSSFCSFTVNVQDSSGTGIHSGGGGTDTVGNGDPDAGKGTWQFAQNSANFIGTFDSVSKDNSTGLATFLHLSGATSTGDTTMSLDFLIGASDIQPGTYTTVSNGIIFAVVTTNPLTILYSADGLTAGTDFTIVVTSYDISTQLMKGTFTGDVKDASGNIVPITNGAFTATVE